MTAVTYPNAWYKANDIYFTPGRYAGLKIPGIYIKPNYSSDRDWVIHVTFHSRGILFLGNAEVKNVSDSFLYRSYSFTNYRDSKYTDSLKKTFQNAEDTSFLWSDFR